MSSGYFKISVRSHDALGDDAMHQGPGGEVPPRPLTYIEDDGTVVQMRDPDPHPKKIHQWFEFFDIADEKSVKRARIAALAKFKEVQQRAQGEDKKGVRVWSTHHGLVMTGEKIAA